MSARALPNLDFLRSVAVLLVVFDHLAFAINREHLGPFTAGSIGTSGVILFFVHTSLVLMWSLERKPHTLDFYIRRVFRIYPLAIAAVLVAAATHWGLAPLPGTGNWFRAAPLSWRLVTDNALLIQNLTGRENILYVLWSLPLEIQMYMVLPVLYFFASRQKRVWPLIVVWALLAQFCRIRLAGDWYNLGTAAPLFIPGVMAYIGFAKRKAALPAWTFPLALLLLLVAYWRDGSVPLSWVLALITGLALPFFHEFRATWLVKASHKIAKYSFGIYLAHPFGLLIGFHLMVGRPFALKLAVALGFTAVVSVVGYHLVEKPFINLGTRVAAKAERRYEGMEPAA